MRDVCVTHRPNSILSSSSNGDACQHDNYDDRIKTSYQNNRIVISNNNINIIFQLEYYCAVNVPQVTSRVG